MNTLERDPVTEAVIGAAIEVHRILGPGLLESLYHRALCRELLLRQIRYSSQMPVEVEYKGEKLGSDLRIDLVVESELVVELKAVDELDSVHSAQLLTYMKLTNIQKGLLINFNQRLLKHGLKRMVLGLQEMPDMYHSSRFRD